MDGTVSLEVERNGGGAALAWRRDGRPWLRLPLALTVEVAPAGTRFDHDGARHQRPYDTVTVGPDGARGEAILAVGAVSLHLHDHLTQAGPTRWRLDRRLQVAAPAADATGIRLLLELRPDGGYDRFRYFAPPAVYDLNDLNRDGVDDYLETRTLFFRDDKLNLRTILAFDEGAGCGVALSRADRPDADPVPDRGRGQTAFLQRTRIGSLGFQPEDEAGGGMALVGAFPFVERDRSHALLVRERSPWGAFHPVGGGDTLAVSYFVDVIEAPSFHDALWQVWLRRLEDLDPQPVVLPAPHQMLADLRLDALLDTLMEEADGVRAAGFVTNCHPQDGRQLGNVVQYGFTGQNTLNALNLLRSPRHGADPEIRRRALRVIDFFVETAAASPLGLSYGLYNFDTRRFGSWWTGLLLPLAYAEPGGDLERLMGPIYQLLGPVIDALRGRDGTYLRCAAEEYDALLEAWRHERDHGVAHPEWLEACRRFGRFLLAAQQPDGSWYRAYSFAGEPLLEPDFWFGQTEVQRKSSTATVIPLLLGLHEADSDPACLEAAVRAGRFVQARFVDDIKFNGGIHDSIYAKPQLVDGESIIFPMRALLLLHKATGETPDRATGEAGFLDGAVRAARLVATWTCLWDVPLPPQSTLAGFGFRSTGWMACDAPGAGYVHPMGLLAVPDLVEVGLLARDAALLRAAALIQAGCNETVAVPGRDWGYARPGLQEEGLLLSWWFADDPMFADTGFGGRGKGEGNKTCLPWIAAVGVFCHQELLRRFGSTDIEGLARAAGLDGSPADR